MIRSFYKKLIEGGTALQNLFLLAIRCFWGWQFFLAGRGKFAHIASIIDFFQSLHIPFPLAHAYLVASVELVGGILLILGLFTRLATLPLLITMIVALLTAHHKEAFQIFSNPSLLLSATPFTYLYTSLILLSFGPGRYSLDNFFKFEVAKK